MIIADQFDGLDRIQNELSQGRYTNVLAWPRSTEESPAFPGENEKNDVSICFLYN